MTVGIVVACKEGIVAGADRKVTRSRGTRIKSLVGKIHKLSFRDGRSLLVCGSGSADLTERAVDTIDPSDLDKDIDCSLYRDMVEGRISRLQSRLADRGLNYDAALLFAMIDVNNKPVIGHITSSGFTEMKHEGYFTTGIAAPYAELVLKDSYSPSISVEDARLIVGGLIEKIGEVDNDVEGMDVLFISLKDKEVKELAWADRQGIKMKPLSFNFKDELDELKQAIKDWQEFLDRKGAMAVKKVIKKKTRPKKQGL